MKRGKIKHKLSILGLTGVLFIGGVYIVGRDIYKESFAALAAEGIRRVLWPEES